VQRLVQIIEIEIIIHVLVAEPPCGTTGTDGVPVVVVVGDVQMARVEVAEFRVVADEGRFPVVVEVVPGDGDVVRGANDVDLAVLGGVSEGASAGGREERYVCVGAFGDVRGEFVVVHPDAGGVANSDAVIVNDEADLEIADDDVGDVLEV
jgi:hypothetical protein